jgi:hypothetical protein
MERLRERLAEKLGAQAPEGEKNKYVMRVSTHGESGESTISAGRASTAAVAAAHRADPARGGAIDSRAAPAGADPHAHAGPAHWDYTGAAGPDAWGQLKPEFSTCSTGTRQSPIDIRGGIAVELAPIQFDYRPSGFGVIDNGHTVQVNVAPGNSISVMGRRYDLVQFHFHRPSEERIDGRQFDMVAHMVHKDVDGRLAVVAIARHDRPDEAVAGRPALLHLHGLAHHAAVQRGRAVDGDEAADEHLARAGGDLLEAVPDERAADPAGGGAADQGVQLTGVGFRVGVGPSA